MTNEPSGCLEDASGLWERHACLTSISKDARGELRLLDSERQVCDERDCVTLKTDHVLKVEVSGHQPCDTKAGSQLDGVLYVRQLVTAFADGTGEGRGPHTGRFVWAGSGVRVHGTLSGMTNVGTHREPVFDPCQVCHAPGYMEGRLCGTIIRATDDRLRGCKVTAVYRFRFDPSEGAIDTGITGTIEGVFVCPCGKDKCLDLTGYPVMAYPNPWTVGGHTFQVFNHTGAPMATANVVTDGGFTGLNAGWETRIGLSGPVSAVDITLRLDRGACHGHGTRCGRSRRRHRHDDSSGWHARDAPPHGSDDRIAPRRGARRRDAHPRTMYDMTVRPPDA